MELREQFALTFLLETYIKFPSEAYKYSPFNGIIDKKFIQVALSKLLKENIISCEELSEELKENYNVFIYPNQLKRYSHGNFEKFKLIKKASSNNETST